MTPDQIIQWRKEANDYAGLHYDKVLCPDDWQRLRDTRFAQLVASHKQEQCAQVCDDSSAKGSNEAYVLAKAIRALKD